MADNDTHGETGKGWYGFDLDGTLAKYDGWKGIDNIGDPVWPMVNLMKDMHKEGKVVKVMTARVAPKDGPAEVLDNPYRKNHWCIQSPDTMPWALEQAWGPLEFVQEWCYRHLGFVPEIVYQKDHLMLELYDDRVKQVIPNLGYLVEDIAASKRVVRTIERVEYVHCKWGDRYAAFSVGVLVACILFTALTVWRAKSVPEAVRDLDKAVQQYHDARMDSYLKELVR